jgi:hypothetical protein
MAAIPTAMRITPAMPRGDGLSFKRMMPTAADKRGPVPLATGYTTERSPSRYPNSKRVKYKEWRMAERMISRRFFQPRSGLWVNMTHAATGAYISEARPAKSQIKGKPPAAFLIR